MKIVIVSGSTRANSQSAKVSQRLAEKVDAQGATAELIDLHATPLPLYDDTDQPAWGPVAKRLEDADGFVLVTPEWNGSASPGMMSFLTYTSSYGKPLAHRPTLIAGVSSGAGGAYPIAQLKAFGNKNNFPVFIPDHLRFRDVGGILNSPEPEAGNEVDAAMHARSDYAIKILIAYAEKLREIRSAGIIDLKTYANGN